MMKSMKRMILTGATVMVLMSTAAPVAMAAPATDYRDCWISPICGIWPR